MGKNSMSSKFSSILEIWNMPLYSLTNNCHEKSMICVSKKKKKLEILAKDYIQK